jgi:superfamily I DNA/RNA helicase
MGDKCVLLLTYNARLKDGTRAKRDGLGLTNLHVHSFHAMAARHYSPGCHDDAELLRIIETDAPPKTTPFCYELIIIDEAQDLTPLLYRFVCKVMRDNAGAAPCRVLLMGDERQTIFQARACACRA